MTDKEARAKEAIDWRIECGLDNESILRELQDCRLDTPNEFFDTVVLIGVIRDLMKEQKKA